MTAPLEQLALRQLDDLAEWLRAAQRDEDWRALGYASWEAYLDAEFGADRRAWLDNLAGGGR